MSGRDQQIIVPFVDGMTITTSDSVANVEIRAKSFGPGFCAVEYSTFGGDIGLDAPPLTFSGWTVLVSHLGKATFTLSERVVCDTGVMAEVRYFKEV